MHPSSNFNLDAPVSWITAPAGSVTASCSSPGYAVQFAFIYAGYIYIRSFAGGQAITTNAWIYTIIFIKN